MNSNAGANKWNTWLVSLVVGSTLAALSGSHEPAHADTIYLKRGGSLNGRVVEGESTVELRMSGGSATFNKSEIERIEKNDLHKEPGPTASGRLSQLSAKASNSAADAHRKIQDLLSGKGRPSVAKKSAASDRLPGY